MKQNQITKPDYSLKNIQWRNLLFFIAMPIIGVIGLYAHVKYEGWNPWLLLLTSILYILTAFGITAGYHRLFAHRAYKTKSQFVKLFFLLFGAATLQESVAKWATDHRRHHAKVDTDEDPYGITKGFFYAHIGWIFIKSEEKYEGILAKDLMQDKLIKWQHDYYTPIALIVSFGLPTLIGYFMGCPIGAFALAGVLRMCALHQATFLINSGCHKWGKQPYTDTNTAKDSITMAVLTMGEGYHNFHHIFQADYRNGIRWYHWDPSKWLINTLSFFNLVDKLIVTPELEITKAKLTMDKKALEKRLSKKKNKKILDLSSFEMPHFELPTLELPNIELPKFDFPNLEIIRKNVQTAQKKLQLLKKEYARARREIPEKGKERAKERIQEIKANIKLAKAELAMAYTQWKTHLNTMYQLA